MDRGSAFVDAWLLRAGAKLGVRQQTSRGYPRAVNNLALQALVAVFAADKGIVDQSSTRTAIAEVTAD